MSKFLQAADAVKRLAKTYEQLVTAAAVLEEIGSLDQACDERKAALAEADKELVQAKEYLREEGERLIRIRKSMDDAIAVANTNAATAASQTQARLDEMVNKAQAHVDEIMDAANAAAVQIVADAHHEADTVQAIAENTREEIKGLEAALGEKQAELARLDDAIAKARGKVSAIMEA